MRFSGTIITGTLFWKYIQFETEPAARNDAFYSSKKPIDVQKKKEIAPIKNNIPVVTKHNQTLLNSNFR